MAKVRHYESRRNMEELAQVLVPLLRPGTGRCHGWFSQFVVRPSPVLKG